MGRSLWKYFGSVDRARSSSSGERWCRSVGNKLRSDTSTCLVRPSDRPEALEGLVQDNDVVGIELREHQVDVRTRICGVVEIDLRLGWLEVSGARETMMLFTIKSRAGSTVTKPGTA